MIDQKILSLLRLCAELAQAAYDSSPAGLEAAAVAKRLGLSVPTWFEAGDTEVFVASDDERVFVAFRGTSSARDVRTDLRALRVPAPWAGTCHRGFLEAFDLVRRLLQDHIALLSRTRGQVIYTGHSLGGALSTLAAAAHCEAGLEARASLITYGSPRVGCGRFARALDAALQLNLRVANNNDAPARVPWRLFGLATFWRWPGLYTHTGQLIYLSRSGELLDSPSLWRVELDRFAGRLRALLWALLDGVSDHSIAGYRKALEAQEAAL